MLNLAVKLFLFTSLAAWGDANWSRGLSIHAPRENIYALNEADFERVVLEGRRVALFYPVDKTELLIPYRPLINFFEADPDHPLKRMLLELAKVVSPFKKIDDLYRWLGLHEFPSEIQSATPNPLPPLSEEERRLPMGATWLMTPEGEALTFGCAACHTGDLFGVKVLGLTNRFPRANEFFRQGQELAPYVNTFLYREILNTTEEERKMFVRSKRALKFVGTKQPMALGLDTSLAQVALSLAKREKDPYAKKTELSHRFPRNNKLEIQAADSKPSVWWNLKYKNRWLSDGSIVSGNPVHTNFLWNEIGRGVDLRTLEKWMKENDQKIRSLTAAVFASRPPRYEKFFGEESIDLEKALRGQKHYKHSCQSCHGQYEKAWDLPNSQVLSKAELLQNVRVTYHQQTPVRDVGTDPGRYLGMMEFAADLNRLAISKAIQTEVVPQKGYVPPPLDGIWSRWPYFHNNSIPNLCALLTKASLRPKSYYAGPALDQKKDFNQECVGYPLGEEVPQAWRKNETFYDTHKEGLSNQGHDEKIFLSEGREIYTQEEKLELIEFLKTL